MALNREERYEIRRRIGAGGIGAVYEALDRRLGRTVAVKRLLPPEESEDRGGIGQDLLKEARTLSSFQHPNIVTVLDVGSDEDGVYIVMEFIDGTTVDQAVRPLPMALPAFLSFSEQLLDGLIAAHARDLLHRDLKPSNVMLVDGREGGFRVKILDFGIAKFSRRPALQTVDHSQSILGSIYFMAPEQFERRPLDARTDLYQLGCLFFFALTGAYPFDGESTAAVMNAHLSAKHRRLAELRPDLPASLIAWVESHYRRESEARPASAAESLSALRQAVRATSVAAPVTPPTKPVPLAPRGAAPSPARPQRPGPDRSTTARIPAVTNEDPIARSTAPALVPRTTAGGGPGGTAATARGTFLAGSPSGDRRGRTGARSGGRPLRPWMLVGLIGAVAAVVLGAVLLIPDRKKEAGNGADGLPGTSAPVPVNPPALDRLFVRLDAAEATFRNAELAPSDFGDPVAAWGDLAPLGGDNFAQYFITATPDASRHWPKLVRSASGSRGRALEFGGSHRLIVGRPEGGDPILDHLKDAPFVLLVSLEVPALTDAQGEFIFGWKNASGTEQVALAATPDDTSLSLTLAESSPSASTVRALRPGALEVIAVTREIVEGSSRLRLSVAEGEGLLMEYGTPLESAAAVTDLQELRLGQVLNPGRAGAGLLFSGRLHGVLLYVGRLAPEELTAATRFLRPGAMADPSDAVR